MFKKILIGVLALSVAGAGGAAIAYQFATSNEPTVAVNGIDSDAIAVAIDQTVNQPAQVQVREEQFLAAENAGTPWTAVGEIIAIDDFGMQFKARDVEEEIYVELGPPEYWQSLNIPLSVGDTITIDGTVDEDMYHAYQVLTQAGEMLLLRSEFGQPLWAGGASAERGNGNSDGSSTPQPQAQVDEWVTLEGTLVDFRGGQMAIEMPDGTLLSFQTGQPRFFEEQGIIFSIGDEIRVVGFYEGEQFSAGDITQLATGLRVMLRDPNGRPLWAGPGNGNSNGNGGNGNGNGGNGG